MKIVNRYTVLGLPDCARGNILKMLDAGAVTLPAPTMASSCGFALVTEECNERLNVDSERVWVAMFQMNKKPIPPTVLNDEIERIKADIEAKEKRLVPKKEMKRLKELAILNLLPKAFVVSKNFPVLFLPRANLLLIGSTSEKECESVLEVLASGAQKTRQEPLKVKCDYLDGLALVDAMAEVVKGDEVDGLEKFTAGNSVNLVGASKEQVVVKNMDINSSEVVEHITTYNRAVKKVALVFADDIGFNLLVGESRIVIDGVKFISDAAPAPAKKVKEEVEGEKAAKKEKTAVNLMSEYATMAASISTLSRALCIACPVTAQPEPVISSAAANEPLMESSPVAEAA